MANFSYAIARDGQLGTQAPGDITQGTAAPTVAGTIEVRLDSTVGWTKNEVELALDQITRFIWDAVNGDTTGNLPL